MKRFLIGLILVFSQGAWAECQPSNLVWRDQLAALKDKSCDLNQRDPRGLNLYDIAGLRGNGEMQKYLASKGKDSYSSGLQQLVQSGLNYMGHSGGLNEAVKSYQKANGFPATGKLSWGWLGRFYKDLTRKVQSDLKSRGYKSGVDGVEGKSTVEALQQYREDHKLAGGSYRHLDQQLIGSLASNKSKAKAADREEKADKGKKEEKVEKLTLNPAKKAEKVSAKNEKSEKGDRGSKLVKNEKSERSSAKGDKKNQRELKLLSSRSDRNDKGEKSERRKSKLIVDKKAAKGEKKLSKREAALLAKTKRLQAVAEKASAKGKYKNSKRERRQYVRRSSGERYERRSRRGRLADYDMNADDYYGSTSTRRSSSTSTSSYSSGGDYGLNNLSASVYNPIRSSTVRSSNRANEALAQQRASFNSSASRPAPAPAKKKSGGGFSKVVGRLNASGGGCSIGGQNLDSGLCNSHRQSDNKLCQALMDDNGNVLSITCGKK